MTDDVIWLTSCQSVSGTAVHVVSCLYSTVYWKASARQDLAILRPKDTGSSGSSVADPSLVHEALLLHAHVNKVQNLECRNDYSAFQGISRCHGQARSLEACKNVFHRSHRHDWDKTLLKVKLQVASLF